MPTPTKTPLEKTAVTLILLMVIIQTFYALYAYLDPQAFALVRGTELFTPADTDWIQIYASRTLFVALIIGYLLFQKNYTALAWASLFGLAMPVTDAVLAYNAGAAMTVVYKHIGTALYLLLSYGILRRLVATKTNA